MKKFTTITKIFTVIAILFFILGADNITRTLPEGNDLSTLMCSDNIVYIGDLSRDVLEKCGEPIKKNTIYRPTRSCLGLSIGPSRSCVLLSFY